MRNAPNAIRYHLSATYGQRIASGQRAAFASKRSSHAIVAIVAIFLSAGTAFAQGTVMPPPVFHGFTTAGAPLVSGKLCTYEAGTSTPSTTYTTSALSPGAVNTNPVILNARGEATVFLRPGESYKFVLMTPGSDTTCATGTVLWTVDNISALPTSNVNLDIDGTAGESLAAGDAVCLSDGQGSKVAGSWYKADADLSYLSSECPFIGVVPTAIASAASGVVRIKGIVDVTGPLSPSTTYFVSATAGGYTTTAPTLVRNVGVGYTATSILVSPANSGKLPALSTSYLLNAVALNALAQGRLTLTTALPVTTADVTGATTLYYALYQGNQIALYTGTYWQATTFAQLSIAVPATTNTMYDVFVDYNDGTTALSLTAWTNDTTRATALIAQDGVWVKTGDTQQRYVGSFRTTGVSGQTEDSFAKRFVWNYYNRVARPMRVIEATNTWNWTTASWQQANNSTANQVAFVVGVAEVEADFAVTGYAFNSGGSASMAVGIGLDTIAAPTTGNVGMFINAPTNGTGFLGVATLKAYPAAGFHYAAWLEYSITTSGTTTWFGDNNTPTLSQAGITGVYWG